MDVGFGEFPCGKEVFVVELAPPYKVAIKITPLLRSVVVVLVLV